MKRNKKGFTLVELVIVIAVIAILAGVMIAVFSGVVRRANENA
ncbi:MAG: prepilin-type N-terminal cleavage/methylation domain-containing protein, partial [Clostridia bacterium]|nr:prepilin-type N-terminal cleavage/methylation domain-containing protein [Clostridia bacterium]